MARLEFFSEDRIALHREVKMHPELMAQINPSGDFAEKLGVVAAYVNIALDDYYTEEDIDSICSMIVSRLRDRRATIILPPGATYEEH
jgi:hypothetical protein